MSTTNASNQVFEWGRFTAALRKELVENKRQLILIVVSLYLFFTVAMVLGHVIVGNMSEESFFNKFMSVMQTTLVMSVYSIVMMVTASLAFRNLTSKPGRVALFTSPSSNTEKFIVNILIYVICMMVAFFASAQLADLTRYIVLSPFQSPTFVVAPPVNYIDTILNGPEELMSMTGMSLFGGQTKWMMLLSLIFGPAMYFMGSVLWPRWAVIKTFAASQVISIFVNMILFAIFAAPQMLSMANSNDPTEMVSTMSGYTRIATYISYVMSAVCWVGAWYLFKHKDVVSLKWWS